MKFKNPFKNNMKIDLDFVSDIKPDNSIKFRDYGRYTKSLMNYSKLLKLIVEYPIEYFKTKEGREPQKKEEYRLAMVMNVSHRKTFTSIFGKHQDFYEGFERSYIWSFKFKNEIFFILCSKKGTSYEMIGNNVEVAEEFLKNIHQKLYSELTKNMELKV